MTFHSSISSPSFSDGNPLSSMIANGARAMSACCTSMGGRATCAFSGQFNAAIPSVTIAIAMLDWQEEDAPRKKASISFFRSFRSVRRDSRSTERLYLLVGHRQLSGGLDVAEFMRCASETVALIDVKALDDKNRKRKSETLTALAPEAFQRFGCSLPLRLVSQQGRPNRKPFHC